MFMGCAYVDDTDCVVEWRCGCIMHVDRCVHIDERMDVWVGASLWARAGSTPGYQQRLCRNHSTGVTLT